MTRVKFEIKQEYAGKIKPPEVETTSGAATLFNGHVPSTNGVANDGFVPDTAILGGYLKEANPGVKDGFDVGVSRDGRYLKVKHNGHGISWLFGGCRHEVDYKPLQQYVQGV